MIATLTINQAGQIELPEAARQLFGAEAGSTLKAEVSVDRIEIIKEIPDAISTMLSSSGRLVLAPTGIKMDAGKAMRAERDAMAERGLVTDSSRWYPCN